jgi:ABC-type glutathione transport system ATPase component
VARPTHTILDIRDLTVSYKGRDSRLHRVLDRLNLQLGAGEAAILSGDSGAGKTTLALAIIGLLPGNARIERGAILFHGLDLLCQNEREWGRIRGAEIGFAFQEPAAALNPVLCAGDQIMEAIRAHRRGSHAEYHEAARALLRDVRLDDSPQFFRKYPHELSGGQKQRVVLAQALASKPSLLIADEPTAAVDSRTQDELVDLLCDLNRSLRLSMLVISHAPATFERLADRAMVLDAGRLQDQKFAMSARHMH